MSSKEPIGIRLKMLRKEMNKTQKEIGDALSITSQAYSQYERSSRMPDVDMLKKLAEFYDVSIGYLLGLEPVRKNDLPLRDDVTDWPLEAQREYQTLLEFIAFKHKIELRKDQD